LTSDNGRRRVVVTGLGALTPLGNDPQSFWEGIVAGESGAGPITLFDPSGYPVTFSCELKDFDPTSWIDVKSSRKMDRFTQMVVAAAIQAHRDTGLEIEPEEERIGASIATGIGGLKSFQDCHAILWEKGPDRVGPFSIPSILPNMGAGWVSIWLGTRGPLSSECTACPRSASACASSVATTPLPPTDA